MSGICGLVHSDARPPAAIEASLTAMLATLTHLGPEGSARHLSAGIGLGELVDLQTPEMRVADLPSRDERSGCVVVADVRLDNRAELAESLGVTPIDLARVSDQDLLRRAYERWGSDCASRLLGDYCFAVWEARSRRLVLVRDAMGVRPCFYANYGESFAFASELKGLLALEGVPRTLDETRVADYLSLELDDLERTFYAAVKRLPPAHVLEVTLPAQSKRRYWRLELGPELKLASRQEYTEAFRSLLVDAVEKRLRTPAPLGFLLSGGLDSSSLVGIAKSRLPAEYGALKTFSALFPDYPRTDERAYIDLVLSRGSFEPHFVRADRASPLGNIEQELHDQDEPFFAPNTFVDSLLLDSARGAGVRVILDGLDGDTTVAHGWEFMAELLRRLRVRRLYRLARDFAGHTDKSRWWFLWRHAVAPTALGLWRRLLGRSRVRLPRFLNPKFASRVGQLDRLREFQRARTTDLLSSFRSLHHAKLTSGLMPACYEVAAKQAGARGMIRRHPYYDRRLVEFCLSLPASERIDRGVDRLIQRRAVEGFTPEEIRTRLTKSIWVENAKDRLRLDDREALLKLGKKDTISQFISLKELDKVVVRCLRGTASEPDLTSIWLAGALDVWIGGRR